MTPSPPISATADRIIVALARPDAPAFVDRLPQVLWKVGLELFVAMGLAAIAAPPLATAAVPSSCIASVEAWAEAMTVQLPGYANRAFRRANTPTQVSIVGLPEAIPTVNGGGQPLDWVEGNDELAQVYFSTFERQQGDVSGRSLLQRAYRVDLARPRDRAAPWLPIAVRVAQSSQANGGGRLAPRDASQGAIAQGIARWQEAGCPGLESVEP